MCYVVPDINCGNKLMSVMLSCAEKGIVDCSQCSLNTDTVIYCLTTGINPQTQAVTVGYRVDNQEDGSIGVAPPDSLRHLPKKMIQVVKVFYHNVLCFVEQYAMALMPDLY